MPWLRGRDLVILLTWTMQRALAQHDCDMAVVHDDDLKRIMGFGSRTVSEVCVSYYY